MLKNKKVEFCCKAFIKVPSADFLLRLSLTLGSSRILELNKTTALAALLSSEGCVLELLTDADVGNIVGSIVGCRKYRLLDSILKVRKFQYARRESGTTREANRDAIFLYQTT